MKIDKYFHLYGDKDGVNVHFEEISPPTEKQTDTAEWKEKFKQEIEIANKDIDLMPEQEDYMRGYLGGILCAYRIVFGKNYEESEGEE